MSSRSSSVPVVVIGAGPFGLSLAAHLRLAGVPFRIFGRPMQTWHTEMPRGMRLKSDGFASNLSAAAEPYTLAEFCRENNIPYHDTDIPVELETFQRYGEEFARRRVPTLEQQQVTTLADSYGQFSVTLASSEEIIADNVILATGLSGFAHIPRSLQTLAPGIVTHSSLHTHFEPFAGKDVIVLGRGASALNAAALLGEAGARTTVLSRHPKVRFHESSVGFHRNLWHRLRHPRTTIGSSLRSFAISEAPLAVKALPDFARRILAFKHLGPSGGYWLRDKVLGKMPILAGWHIVSAEMHDARAVLYLRNQQGETKTIEADHIIAGTGFHYDLAGMRFLTDRLRDTIRIGRTGAPRLNRHFEASVPGLYFAGPAAASSFGQLFRFVAGAEYAATSITRTLHRKLQTTSSSSRPEAALQRP